MFSYKVLWIFLWIVDNRTVNFSPKQKSQHGCHCFWKEWCIFYLFIFFLEMWEHTNPSRNPATHSGNEMIRYSCLPPMSCSHIGCDLQFRFWALKAEKCSCMHIFIDLPAKIGRVLLLDRHPACVSIWVHYISTHCLIIYSEKKTAPTEELMKISSGGLWWRYRLKCVCCPS